MEKSLMKGVITGFLVILTSVVAIAAPSVTLVENEGSQSAGTSAGTDTLTFLSSDMPPFGTLQDGKQVGFAVEILHEIMRRLGRADTIEFDDWKVVYERALTEPYTALWPPSRTPEREELFKWVGPLIPEEVVLFARKDSGLVINSLEDAKEVGGIATVTGYASEKLLKQKGFSNLVSQRSPMQGPDALKFGRVDLWINSNITMRQTALAADVDSDLFEPVFVVKEIPSYLAFSKSVPDEVVNRWQISLDHMKQDGSWERIVSNWIPAELRRIGGGTLDLSEKERLWIEAHPTVKVVDFFQEPPFTLDVADSHTGYLYDLLFETLRMAGLRAKFVGDYSSYDSMVDALQNGAVDILTTMENTRRLPDDIVRTIPVVKTPYALVAKISAPGITRTSDLFDRKVAVVKGYAQDQHLDRFPRIEKVHVRNNEEGFEAVRMGRAEYFLNNLANADYVLKKTFATDLRIAGTLSYVDFPPLALSFGVHGINSALPGIINKALTAVPINVLAALRDKWLPGELASTSSDRISLTPEEHAFIEKHPVIRVSNEMGYRPFDFAKDGRPKGYSIDYLNILAERLGIRLEYVNGYSWNELLSMFERRDLDLIQSAMETEERLRYTVFTRPYVNLLHALVTRKGNNNLKTLDDLKGRTLAMMKGWATNDYILPRYPDIEILWVGDTLEGLKAVAAGQADAVIDAQPVVSYLIREYFLTNLSIASRLEFWDEDEQALRVGVRSDWPLLKTILEKAMDTVAQSEEAALRAKWFGMGQAVTGATEVSLNKEEQDYLNNHPVLRIAFDVDWPPVEFSDKDLGMNGMAADYLAKMSERLGVEFEPSRPRPWKEMLKAVENGELDFFSAITPTPQRWEWLDFTDSYHSFPIVIITGKEVPYIGSMSDLGNKPVAVVDGYASHDLLLHNHPDLSLMPVRGVKEGLLAVSTGKAFAFVGSLASASHVISREGMTELKVSGETPYSFEITMGTRKNDTVLLEILGKALASISPEERNAINSRWTSVTYEHATDYSLIWRVVAVALIIVAVFFYWNGRLQKEIAERKRAEKGFIESEERYKVLFMNDIYAVIVFETDTRRFIDVNSAFLKLYGYTREEALQLTAEDISAEAEISQVAIKKAKMSGTVFIPLRRHKKKDGTVFFVELSAGPFTWNGRSMMYSILHDITERKATEDQLRNSEQRLAETQRIAQLGTWEFNALTEEITWSEETFRIAGRPQKEKLSLGEYLETVHPDDLPLLQQALEVSTKGQVPYEIELRQRYPDGTYNHTLTKGKPVVRDGSVVGFIGSVLDITTRKKAEDELRRTQEAAEAANRAKSAFLANMSHELRTPLNAVLGFANILAKSGTLSSDDKKNLDIIHRSGEHLLTLINDVLDLSRIEAGKVGLNEIDFDLHSLLDGLELMFELKTKRDGLQLRFIRKSNVPRYIKTDQVKLRQVLINLIGNAIKFTAKGGITVTIDSQHPFPLDKQEASHITLFFEIRDTGSGIAEDDFENIFNPFIQTGKGKELHEGTGLGLSISQRYVQMLGGNIAVESDMGKGTLFKFHVKAYEAEGADLSLSKSDQSILGLAPNQPEYRILIVDDISTNRQLLKSIFERTGFDVREVENGKESLEIWRNWKPHLIWMDMRMPVMDGYDATRKIREAAGEDGPVIIAITASPFEEEKALAAGCDDFVIKPFRENDVIEMAQKHLNVKFMYAADEMPDKKTNLKNDKWRLAPSDFDALPKEIVMKFRKSVAGLEMDIVLDIIEEFRGQNPLLADALKELAEEYRFDTLQKLLDQV